MHTKLLSTKFIVVILLLITNLAQAQSYYSKEKEVLDNIAMLIKEGEYNKLSDYFNNMVELRIPEKEGVFSKTQSKFILKDFFSENTPKSLEFEKWGESE